MNGVRSEAVRPRATPCASCPYRRNVPSGIWDAEEYEKLSRYDADIAQQPTAVFLCHHDDGCACAGWLGYSDPSQLLAVRVGVLDGRVDPACLDYTTDVALFDCGAAAAAHGVADITQPGERAIAAINKLERLRNHT